MRHNSTLLKYHNISKFIQSSQVRYKIILEIQFWNNPVVFDKNLGAVAKQIECTD